ncbi:Holliday junction resolvase RuvX [uncultured Arcanobacterium sp.]|uniref:Holliday junction resolvase RuvX n=1 Tax=uncultured Arcanobacterium sp. TaxID=487520 RepID=UPI002619F6A2|nr:Holliday junction resolvase RuvX [uncultured Arcanobacterium sp.]
MINGESDIENAIENEAGGSGEKSLKPGVRIAVDVGKVRVGIAKTDHEAILALPVGTFRRGQDDITGVLDIISQEDVCAVYVGLPLNMDGSIGSTARNAQKWAQRLAKMIAPIPVRMIDERLSSVSAHRQLQEAGLREIKHKPLVDQAAAVIILESALDFARRTGRQPGLSVKGHTSEK